MPRTVDLLRTWPADRVSAGFSFRDPDDPTRLSPAWTTPDGGSGAARREPRRPGDLEQGPVLVGPDTVFPLASITKPLFAWAVLVAVEEGTLALEQPAGPPGATLADLLAHSSGLGPDGEVLAEPGTRRIYSNAGYDVLGETLSLAAGFPASDYFREAVVEPLGMPGTALLGSPAKDGIGSVRDLLRFAAEVVAPRLISAETRDRALSAHIESLPGVLPGFGRQNPNPWGLGFELKGHKDPHWTAPTNSPSTVGHFGRSGTMLWIDRPRGVAAVVLTDHPFGAWAAGAWPVWSAAVLDAASTP